MTFYHLPSIHVNADEFKQFSSLIYTNVYDLYLGHNCNLRVYFNYFIKLQNSKHVIADHFRSTAMVCLIAPST